MSIFGILCYLGEHPAKMKEFKRKLDDAFSVFIAETLKKHNDEIYYWLEKYQLGECSAEDFADKCIELSKK